MATAKKKSKPSFDTREKGEPTKPIPVPTPKKETMDSGHEHKTFSNTVTTKPDPRKGVKINYNIEKL